MSIISIIVPYSTGWCKSEKLKISDIVQWQMLLLILKNNYFCECLTKSHNRASNFIFITVYIRSCYHPLFQFSYHIRLTTPEHCWHGRCSVYIVYGAKVLYYVFGCLQCSTRSKNNEEIGFFGNASVFPLQKPLKVHVSFNIHSFSCNHNFVQNYRAKICTWTFADALKETYSPNIINSSNRLTGDFLKNG